jgi:hypothetical protein
MGLIRHEHSVEIDGHAITVAGRTGPVHAAWTLSVDGEVVDRASAAGDFVLRSALPDGAPIEAAVHQSLFGPTEVVVRRGGAERARSKGFVA